MCVSDRFYVDGSNFSWAVRDREILIRFGPGRGESRVVEWCVSKEKAEAKARELNATRGRAADEPKCVRCGAQPAGPVGSTSPMCAICHSRLAD